MGFNSFPSKTSRREFIAGVGAAALVGASETAATPAQERREQVHKIREEQITLLREAAEFMPDEVAIALVTSPTGTTRSEILSDRKHHADASPADTSLSGNLHSLDGERVMRVMEVVQKGGSAEFMHTHPNNLTKNNPDATPESGFDHIPPSPYDITDMLVRLKDLDSETAERVRFSVVATGGMWSYAPQSFETVQTWKGVFEAGNHTLETLKLPVLQQAPKHLASYIRDTYIDTDSDEETTKAFEELSDLIESRGFVSKLLSNPVQLENLPILTTGLEHNEHLPKDVQTFVRIVNEACRQVAEARAKVDPDNILRQPPYLGEFDLYVNDLTKMGVKLEFTPFKTET